MALRPPMRSALRGAPAVDAAWPAGHEAVLAVRVGRAGDRVVHVGVEPPLALRAHRPPRAAKNAGAVRGPSASEMTGAIAALRPAFQRAATLTAKGIVATANLRAALELASHPLTAPLHAAGVGGTVGIDDTCLVVSALPRGRRGAARAERLAIAHDVVPRLAAALTFSTVVRSVAASEVECDTVARVVVVALSVHPARTLGEVGVDRRRLLRRAEGACRRRTAGLLADGALLLATFDAPGAGGWLGLRARLRGRVRNQVGSGLREGRETGHAGGGARCDRRRRHELRGWIALASSAAARSHERCACAQPAVPARQHGGVMQLHDPF